MAPLSDPTHLGINLKGSSGLPPQLKQRLSRTRQDREELQEALGREVPVKAQHTSLLKVAGEDFAFYETHHGSDPGYLRSLLSACPGDIAEVSLCSIEELGQVK